MRTFSKLYEEAGAEGTGGGGDPAAAAKAATDAAAAKAAAESKTGEAKPRFHFIKDDFTFEDGWQNNLPDAEFATEKATLANYKSLPALAKALRESKTAAMAKAGLKVPDEKSTPEERAAFAKALGVPDDPKEYGITKPEGELAQYFNEEAAAKFAATAKELGLTKPQAAKLVEMQLAAYKEADAAQIALGQKQLTERDTKLKEVWGAKVEEFSMDAQRVALTIGLDPKELPYLPADVTIGLAKIAALISEDKMVGREQVHNKLTPASQGTDIISNKSNPDHEAYHTQSHPRHKEVVAKVLELMK